MASLGCSGVRLLPRGSGRHLYFVRFCSSEMSPATGSKSSRRTSALKRRLLELQSPVNSDQLELRAKYLQFEREFSQKIQLADLSPEQAAIHARHDEAIQSLHFTYDDPATGLKVFTRLRHFLKGSCCGSACRHCVYDHEKVAPERKRERRFNSAFWEDRPKAVDPNERDSRGFFDR